MTESKNWILAVIASGLLFAGIVPPIAFLGISFSAVGDGPPLIFLGICLISGVLCGTSALLWCVYAVFTPKPLGRLALVGLSVAAIGLVFFAAFFASSRYGW